MNLRKLFVVQHSYEVDGIEESKFIGVFSSEATAQRAIEILRNQPGFKEHPNDFFVDPCVVDEVDWKEGFFEPE